MRIFVYPHDLDMGGSQMNAIELAAAISRMGHECIIFGRRGALCERIEELGLEFIESPEPGRRPSIGIARTIREIVTERGIDIVHGYEWPPGLEAAMATESLPDAASICTVMSMAVAPFLPSWMPLVVGTQQISAAEQSRGRLDVNLIEPPVDLEHNAPLGPVEVAQFREKWGLDERPVVACVSRLVPDLKAEGILTAIEATAHCADTTPFQLLVVGDGRSRPEMEAAAAAADARSGRKSIVFTGELADPRAAYAAADIVLGMGGSALRSLAFGKPLIVQGEKGFFRTLTPETVDLFRWQGWYGIGDGFANAVAHLVDELSPLLASDARRRELGAFSREVVEDFSLETAAHRQLAIYRDVWSSRHAQKGHRLGVVPPVLKFGDYYIRRKLARLRGTRRTDDFNAVPVAGDSAGARRKPVARAADGPILYFSGVAWDTLAGTDRQLAIELSRMCPIVWVDTSRSLIRRREVLLPAVSRPHENIVRLRVDALPGVQRPFMRGLADRRRAAVARRYLRKQGIQPRAVIAATTAPVLALTADLPGLKILFETDDSVAASALWGVSKRYLASSREANLAAADLVLAVTPELGRHLQRRADPPRWLANGTDVSRYAEQAKVEPADVGLASPIAGVIGQFNARTDIALLAAVQEAGISLLLVGPRWFTSDQDNAAFDDLIGRPGVRWVDRVPQEELPRYLRVVDVGLTPYVDSMFNRRSYPLKTLEYLAAGVPVVATDVATTRGLDGRFVTVATGTEEFIACIRRVLAAEWDRSEIRASVASEDWRARADQLLEWIDNGVQK